MSPYFPITGPPLFPAAIGMLIINLFDFINSVLTNSPLVKASDAEQGPCS